ARVAPRSPRRAANPSPAFCRVRPGEAASRDGERPRRRIVAPVDWAVLLEHARTMKSARLGREPAAEATSVVVDPEQVLAYRLVAMQLHRRLPAGRCDAAAFAGLQDSVPRAGLLALHARMKGVGPGTWEDAALAQIWFR